jgi:hypothetical protein
MILKQVSRGKDFEMKSKDEIKNKLAEIEADERLHYPPATVFENAPLALIQTELEAKQNILRWALEENPPITPKRQRPHPDKFNPSNVAILAAIRVCEISTLTT